MALEPTKHVNGRMWQPGQSGNPNGRPVGSRTAFSAGFLKDLAEVWSEEGREAMVKTAKTNPTVFFDTCARLIGPEVKLTIEQQLPGNLSPADWNLMVQILDAVKSAIPDAANRPAGKCLSLCLAHLETVRKMTDIRTVLFAPAEFVNNINGRLYNRQAKTAVLRFELSDEAFPSSLPLPCTCLRSTIGSPLPLTA